MVWLTNPPALGFRNEHGGHRVFPVGHERRKRAPTREVREVRELRAALAWYAGRTYDGSR